MPVKLKEREEKGYQTTLNSLRTEEKSRKAALRWDETKGESLNKLAPSRNSTPN